MQSEASADAATDEAATHGNAALSQAAGTASNPPDFPLSNGHNPLANGHSSSANGHSSSANGLTPAAQTAVWQGKTVSTGPGSAPLKGVPALPECRVKLVVETDESKASQIRQAELQRPFKSEAAYRDPEGMYSPEQPFWALVSDARSLCSADSDRQVSRAHSVVGLVSVDILICCQHSDTNLLGVRLLREPLRQ